MPCGKSRAVPSRLLGEECPDGVTHFPAPSAATVIPSAEIGLKAQTASPRGAFQPFRSLDTTVSESPASTSSPVRARDTVRSGDAVISPPTLVSGRPGDGVATGAATEGAGVGVAVGAGAAVRHLSRVIVFVSRVTAPFRASARPSTMVAPVCRAIDVNARMLPLKVVVVPRVAELPTCQYTLQAWAPLIRLTVLAGAVVSVLPNVVRDVSHHDLSAGFELDPVAMIPACLEV